METLKIVIRAWIPWRFWIQHLIKDGNQVSIFKVIVCIQGVELGGWDLQSKNFEILQNHIFFLFNQAPHKKFASAHPASEYFASGYFNLRIWVKNGVVWKFQEVNEYL